MMSLKDSSLNKILSILCLVFDSELKGLKECGAKSIRKRVTGCRLQKRVTKKPKDSKERSVVRKERMKVRVGN